MGNKVKKKVHLSIFRCNNYMIPNAPEFKEKYPRYKEYNSSVYLNDYRVMGPNDFDKSFIFNTYLSGRPGIETVEILKALNIPDDIINQIEFED